MRDVLRSRADTLTLLAIQDSIPTYRSEVKRWLLFLQASGRTMREVLNPDVSIVIQYITIFTNWFDPKRLTYIYICNDKIFTK